MDSKPYLGLMVNEFRRWIFIVGVLIGLALASVVVGYGIPSLAFLALALLCMQRAKFHQHRLMLLTQVRPIEEMPKY